MSRALPAWASGLTPVDMDGAAALLGISRRYLVDVIAEHKHYERRGVRKVFYPEHIQKLRKIIRPPVATTAIEVVAILIDRNISGASEAKLAEFLGRPVEGIVYLIRCAGRIKIGFASDFGKRMRGLRTACPYPIEVVAAMPGDRTLELFLHRCFKGLRRHGEWFEESGVLREITQGIEALPK